MQYLGSKQEIAVEILRIMTRDRNGAPYVEPFLGGANTMSRVWYEYGRKIGGDSHFYLIEMWRALISGWIPPEHVTREQYIETKDNPHTVEPCLYGYIGFACSMYGKWWAGYSGTRKARPEYRIREKSYQASARESILRQVPRLLTVELHHCSYTDLPIPSERSIIYCDPPYENTTKYDSGLNYEEFWEWCRCKAHEGHSVFVSGYNAPDDFHCVWQKRTRSIEPTGALEKLFTYQQQEAEPWCI